MKRLMVRYRAKSERAIENTQYIAKVFEQLRRDQPPGIRYASFRLDDGVSFVHVASIETADGSSPLNGVVAFKEFVEHI